MHQLADSWRSPSLYGVVELDDERPDRRHRGEARAPAQRPRLDGDVPLLARARRGCSSRYLDEGEPARPARPVRRLAAASASRSTASASPRPGSTSANHEQLLEADNRYRAAAGLPARERVLARVAEPRIVAFWHRVRHRHVTAAGSTVGRRGSSTLLLPRAASACGAPGRSALRRLPARLRPIAAPLCARCGAPTAWPVERCRECSGRRLAFASARAAVAYSGPGPAARARVEGARAPPARRPGRRARRRARAPAGGRRHHVYPARRRPEPAARPPSGRGARPRARAALGASTSRRCSPGRGRSARQTGLAARRAAAERARRVRGGAPGAAGASCSSTTSTRPAPPLAAAATALRRRRSARRVDVVSFARAVR